MNKRIKLLLVITTMIGGAFFFNQNDAHALIDSVSTGGHGVGFVGSTEYILTDGPSTERYLNDLCGSSSYNHPVAVAAYPSNISFNTTTGGMTYQANVAWRSCPGGDTRAFAIIGYPARSTGELATCPNAGTYAFQDGTYDCIKYTGSDLGHLRGYASLNCWAGTGYACVTGGSDSWGLFVSHIERMALQPNQWPDWQSTGMFGNVPFWDSAQTSTGGYVFQRSDAFCSYYKSNSNGVSGWGNCVSLRIDVGWIVYNYNLTPTITATRNNGEAGATFQVNPAVANAGPTKSKSTDWTVYRFNLSPTDSVPLGGTSSQAGNVFYGHGATSVAQGSGVVFPTGPTALDALDETVPDLPIGSRVCYGLSVRPYDQSTTDARHSDPFCVVIAKVPKVDILGGDLYVGRKPVGMTTAVTNPRVVTKNSTNAAGTFGSWGEYAIVPAGPIVAMASGSGHVGGNAPQRALLSFVNFNNTTPCTSSQAGCYTHSVSLPNIAARFPTNSSSPVFNSGNLSGGPAGLTVYKSTASDITIAGSSIGPNRSIIINAPDTNVTINGNISYTPSMLGASNNIPQVVIIAKNITIAGGVTNVDAWLIAPGIISAGSVTDGLIRTCDVPASSLNAGICNNKLTINGPVIANRLYMLRTAGAGTATNAGQPAEVFNFRPDAYLWALQQTGKSGVVTTSVTKELPPRY